MLLVLLLVGCGPVKKSVVSEKDEVIKEETEVVETTEEKEVILDKEKITDKDTNVVVDEEFTDVVIRPVDPDKPMIIDGKTYKNTEIRKQNQKKKTEVNEIVSEVEKENKIESVISGKKEEKITDESRASESSVLDYKRDGASWFSVAGLS